MLLDEDVANLLDSSCSTRLDGGSQLDAPSDGEDARMVVGIGPFAYPSYDDKDTSGSIYCLSRHCGVRQDARQALARRSWLCYENSP
jgi:hypothetical protein